jgi:hypothetical protein
MKRLFITFGCSWTWGVGAGYVPDLGSKDSQEYRDIAWNEDIANNYSFRGILCKKYNFVNKNFAEPGSSNQRQFRLAKLFFTSLEFKRLQADFDQIIVLWALTATDRNELYLVNKKGFSNFTYSNGTPEGKAIVAYFYDHGNEVMQLETEMAFWNDYFKSKNISNLWVDTFNHHTYPQPVDNLVKANENPRDLLSLLAAHNGCTTIDRTYHSSQWAIESSRVKYLVNKKILNPISIHPTKLGHAQIADILAEHIEKLL